MSFLFTVTNDVVCFHVIKCIVISSCVLCAGTYYRCIFNFWLMILNSRRSPWHLANMGSLAHVCRLCVSYKWFYFCYFDAAILIGGSDEKEDASLHLPIPSLPSVNSCKSPIKLTCLIMYIYEWMVLSFTICCTTFKRFSDWLSECNGSALCIHRLAVGICIQLCRLVPYIFSHLSKKVKIAHTRLPSVGFRS